MAPMSNLAKMHRLLLVQAAGVGMLLAAATVAYAQSQIVVPGMSKYTDAASGYSFWYPSSWKVTEEPVAGPDSSGWFQGGKVVKALRVDNHDQSGDVPPGVTIEVFSSTSHSITEMGADSANPVGVNQKYFFDETKRIWMYAALSEMPDGRPPSQFPADVSHRTIGGLPIFSGAARHGADSIVPLSRDTFLVLNTMDPGGDMGNEVVAATVVSLLRGAASMVSARKQIDAIRREGILLGALGTPLGAWYIDSQNVYNQQGNPIPGANPATFRLIATEGPGSFFATDGKHVYSEDGLVVPGADPATFVAIDLLTAKDARHNYSWRDGGLLVDGRPVPK